MTEPDEELELPDVGTVDDMDPVELESGDEAEVAPVPNEWDAEAHAEEYADDPLVDTTEVELEGDEEEEATGGSERLLDM